MGSSIRSIAKTIDVLTIAVGLFISAIGIVQDDWEAWSEYTNGNLNLLGTLR